jgi:cell division septum initiation protein DivIVA
MKLDEKPDMLELKPYSEIDLDESPIVALGCGHFFTVETLDGHIGLREVYEQDPMTGHYTRLTENAQLTVNVPQCPYCKTPIRQFVTQRYNRVINKAVIDEMTKRFIVSSQQELHELEIKVEALGTEMETSRHSVIPGFSMPTGDPAVVGRALEYIRDFLSNSIENRYTEAQRLEQRIEAFQKRTATKQQPASKLHQATVHALNKKRGLDNAFELLSLRPSITTTQHGGDERIKHSGHLLHLKVQFHVLEDKFGIARAAKGKVAVDTVLPDALSGHLVTQVGTYLNDCINTIEGCVKDSLPKLAVETTLYYSRIVQLLCSSGLIKDGNRKQVESHRENAKELLENALKLCEQPFKGAKELADAVDLSLRLLGKEFYAEVSKEEIEAIKKAMLNGPGGIATHSGHWYKCVRGHPVSFTLTR